ncbi:hypothetical protein IAQ61_002978 [Plenodomus lingam]|uniref:uncharacterized protein n=1 Tax=Leptosphaeria maculans TaxID=5022 RepID=UPI00332073EE|nr:hypothetical protein IAQ61_002978 [Plenodomus lingam]
MTITVVVDFSSKADWHNHKRGNRRNLNQTSQKLDSFNLMSTFRSLEQHTANDSATLVPDMAMT